MPNFGPLIVVIAVCLVGAPADAQTLSNTGRAFVDVPLGPVWDDAYSDSTRVPGATWGSGLAFGFDWGRSGVEFDVGVPQWHVKNFAPRRYHYGGPSFGWEQQGHLRVVRDGASPFDRCDGIASRQRACQSTRHVQRARRGRFRVSIQSVHQRDEGGAARWTADRREYRQDHVVTQLPGSDREARRRVQSHATRVCRAPSADHGISIAVRR